MQRHNGAVPTEVRLAVDGDELLAQVSNAAGRGPRASRGRGGGHGLAGIRERVQLLGGSLEAGAMEHGWLLRAVIPTGERRR